MQSGQPQPLGRAHASSSSSERSRPAVFVFVGCTEEVLSGFERAVHTLEVADRVEPIAVSTYPPPEYLEAFLEENRKDIAGVTISLRDPAEAISLIKLVAKMAPDALVLATDDGSRSESLLPALRAGARDVIAPPYDMAVAIEGVFRPDRGRKDSSGQVACFLPAQGGAGASTAAIHFAASVSSELRGDLELPSGEVSPVLLIDLDFHSDSTAFWLNKRPGYSLIDVLEGSARSSRYWRKVTTAWNGIDLLSPPPPDRYVSEEMLATLPRMVASAQEAYRWVVIDLPPALFASTRKLLPLTDVVYLVCTPEARALYRTRRRVADLRGLGVPDERLKVTLNRAGAKRSIEAETAEKSIGAPVQFSIDNDYVEINSAYSERRLASPSSASGRQFKAMARAALGMQVAQQEKPSGWRRLVGFG